MEPLASKIRPTSLADFVGQQHLVAQGKPIEVAIAKKHGNLPIPMSIRNAPTKLMKDFGYGEGYEKYTTDDLLPEKLKGTKYFKEK